jgi:hypothetical protein
MFLRHLTRQSSFAGLGIGSSAVPSVGVGRVAQSDSRSDRNDATTWPISSFGPAGPSCRLRRLVKEWPISRSSQRSAIVGFWISRDSDLGPWHEA